MQMANAARCIHFLYIYFSFAILVYVLIFYLIHLFD